MGAETTDQALVARSCEGDTEAFRLLFDRKHRLVYLIAYQVLGERGAAEDVAQEVFVQLWRRCHEYDPGFPLDAWLRRIATNRAIDHWRARRREGRRLVPAAADADALGESAAAPTPSTDPELRLDWQRLQGIWDDIAAGLPPQQRAAFVLRHIEGLETAAVAEALECSASTVRSHVAEARRSLREALRRRYPELTTRS